MMREPMTRPLAAGTAVADLAAAVLSVRPLLESLAGPVRISACQGRDAAPCPADGRARTDPGGAADLAAVIGAIARGVGVGNLLAFPERPGVQLTGVERLVSDRLAVWEYRMALAGLGQGALAEIATIASQVADAGFDRYRSSSAVIAADGVPLLVYAAGARADRAVVISSACAMPVQLCERWLEALGPEHLVLTWQSRGLDATNDDFDAMKLDALTQAADLIAVLDRYGVRAAHVMGICTGSVIALAAAAAYQERVRSLSLWHGAYEFGPDELKTSHHVHMQALMAMAAQDRRTAAAAHAVLWQATARSTPPDLAHLVLCPFATPELLYRYCKVNGTITQTAVAGFLHQVAQPTLVVTSEDDDTAHPDASRAVAAGLADATLAIEPHGNHLSLFKAGPRLERLATGFIDATALMSGR